MERHADPMSEPLSLAAQIHVPQKTFKAWLRLALADGQTVLDVLASFVDQADRNPGAPLLCQYVPDQQQLLFFQSGGRNLDDAAPALELFNQLARLTPSAGYVCAGRYPFGDVDELACWRVSQGELHNAVSLPPGTLMQLMPRVDTLIGWVPEQRRHEKELYFRSLVLRFQKLGNAWVRRASPDSILLYDDYDRYATDGARVYYGFVRADTVVVGADPYRFRRLAGRLWADDGQLYCGGRGIVGLQRVPRVVGKAVIVDRRAYLAHRDGGGLHADDVDPARFKRLASHDDYYADEVHVWHDMCRLPESPASFEVLGDGMARGQQALYLHGRICEGADPRSIVALGQGYFQDASHLWFHNVTAATLTLLGPGAPGSATVRGPWCIGEDAVWFDGHLLPGADPASFLPVHLFYAADAGGVWNQQHAVEDPAVCAVMRNAWQKQVCSA